MQELPVLGSPVAASNSPSTPALVLDTHVLLDLWLFRDPRLAGLEAALAAGALRWHACPSMLEELSFVAARTWGDKWSPTPALANPAQWCTVHPDPAEPAPWRSQDPADQMFLDLAWGLRPIHLWSRDHALLRWRKRAAAAGIWIERPELGWAALKGQFPTSPS